MSDKDSKDKQAKAADPQKAKALDAALSQIERQFGKGTVMRLGDSPREKI
ncbi:MAG: hypothetical protein QMB26_04460, partial [Pseudomonadales bacterium]